MAASESLGAVAPTRIPPAGGAPSPARLKLVLLLLMMTYSFNYLDRQVINILGQSIKLELHLSDLQLGLLTGTAFGIFYSLLGLPIARLADRYNRVHIIAVALTLWSALTAACGIAQSYVQLFALRVGVGVGEAGGTPPAQSLISDLFPSARRGTAMSVFNLGVPLGSFLGFMLGGALVDTMGWRKALIIAGIPGLILAPIVLRVIPEPIRGAADGYRAGESSSPQSFWVAMRGLFDRPSFVRLILGGTFGILIVYITNSWLPPLFIRLHHMTASQVGGWMALSTGLGGALGALGGGLLADALKPYYARAEIWVLMISTALTAPAMYVAVTADSTRVALGAMFLLYTLAYVWMGPTCAMVQKVAPVRSRALATGVQIVVANIIALAFGPPLVGLASDMLAPMAGPQSLRWALQGACLFALFGTLAYGLAGRHISEDVARNAGDCKPLE
jgi:MFS transporter, Spinster family, sphingosine-1-phosphate transporter